jgi:predicted CXXCH cytochrome family protein
MSGLCTNCHQEQAAELADGVHQEALESGNPRAATCVDCHGAHDVQPPGDPLHTAQTCGNCHQFVFNEFKDSIHGEALLAGDPNVPSCTNCHGVHGIAHPTTAQFRNRSPELCATCHADEDLMDQYDITTNVFDSYLSDFHGKTVALFEQQDPNVATNKAVCFDCHGVHDIAEVSDTNSRVIRENLLETCQHCHPDATSNFSDAWVGHYPPTLESHPLLFTVNTFYRFLIPGVIGAFLVLIATDIIRRVRERARRS